MDYYGFYKRVFYIIIVFLLISIISYKNTTSEGLHADSKLNYVKDTIIITNDTVTHIIRDTIFVDYGTSHEHLDKVMAIEIDKYIQKVAPHSKVSGDTLWMLCKKHKIDIKFVMAHAFIESHFGTKGIARYTRSVFNVGTFDDGTILYRYKTHNSSIEPYLILLKKTYLVGKNKSTKCLMKPGRFKNHAGNKYASAKDYEKTLSIFYNKIIKETSIDEVLNLYTSLNKQQNDRNNRNSSKTKSRKV